MSFAREISLEIPLLYWHSGPIFLFKICINWFELAAEKPKLGNGYIK